jgi:hypothetical protein
MLANNSAWTLDASILVILHAWDNYNPIINKIIYPAHVIVWDLDI